MDVLPSAPDERGMARDRFFERMFDRADEAKQQKIYAEREREEIVRQARNALNEVQDVCNLEK